MTWKCYIYQRCQQPDVCGCRALHQYEGSWAARSNWEAIALAREAFPHAEAISVYPLHAFDNPAAQPARWDKNIQSTEEYD